MQSIYQAIRWFFWGSDIHFMANLGVAGVCHQLQFPEQFQKQNRDLGSSLSIAGAKYGDNQVSSTSPKECNDGVGGADVSRTQTVVIGRELLKQIKKKTNAYSASYWPSVAELVLGMTKSEASVVITRI